MSAIATAQAQALIMRVREEAARAVDELRARTEIECQSLRRQARHEARARMHAAVAEKRRRVAERCRAVDIECEEQRRASSFTRTVQLADRALARLPEALAARWRDPEARRTWCESAFATAARVLRGREWIVEVAAGVPEAERRSLETAATVLGASIRQWRDSPAVAGLRIGHDRTWIDATAARLLADRTALASRFFAELPGHGGPP